MIKSLVIVLVLAGAVLAQEAPKKPLIASQALQNQILKAELAQNAAELQKQKDEAAFQQLKADWNAQDAISKKAAADVQAAEDAVYKEAGVDKKDFLFDVTTFTLVATPKAPVPAVVKK